MKIINQTHFVWVTYNREDGRPLLLGGGTCTFDGKTYKENYEFGGPGIPAELVGKQQVFTAELDKDKWTHSGTLTNGVRVEEIWRKVRSTSPAAWHGLPGRGGRARARCPCHAPADRSPRHLRPSIEG